MTEKGRLAFCRNNINNLIKEELRGLYWLNILIVSDVSATTVAFFGKDKKRKCLTASCEVISRKRIP